MPKLTRSPTQQKNDLIVGIIKKYGVNHQGKQIAKMAGICPSTYYACLKNPDEFRLGQIRAICKGLQVPADEMREVLL